jgi:hypothetical protein
MLVMFEVTNPVERAPTMTKRYVKGEATDLKAILSGDDDFLRSAVQAAIQTALGRYPARLRRMANIRRGSPPSVFCC